MPERLKRALEIQAGIRQPDGRATGLESYHINQRDEGINLNGLSGALLATANQQMQTFVTQEAKQETVAFAANQRDEVRDLHDVAGALGAQPGMKQQTFVAAFSAGQGSKAGGIGYQKECVPTLKASESGSNMVPSILCVSDQGGECIGWQEDLSCTLRAQEHGHQPLVLATQQGGAEIGEGICPTITASAGMSGNNQPVLYENHGIDSRYTGPLDVSPTMSARYGTGGNNVPLIEDDSTLCIMGNAIDRQPQNGGNGLGVSEDVAYTLTATDHHAVFSRQRVDEFKDSEVASTESARQHKDATDLVCYGQSQFANYSEGVSTLRAQGGDHGGGSENLVAVEDNRCYLLIRRLIPLECERLQGFPDGWTDLPNATDAARYKALGNSVAIPCVDFVIGSIAQQLRSEWLVTSACV